MDVAHLVVTVGFPRPLQILKFSLASYIALFCRYPPVASILPFLYSLRTEIFWLFCLDASSLS